MGKMKKVLSMFLAIVMVLGTLAVGFTGLASLRASAADDGKLKADANGNFKILQVADIQDSWRSNATVNAWERTVEMIEAAVTLKKPDLIVMTGDNLGPEDSGDRIETRGDFVYSVQRIVEAFHGVPFVVTYGNHDYERNKNGSSNITLQDQNQIYSQAGALTLKQDGMTISSSSANSTARYGTGYLDVYDSTGTTVIERVIVLNSGNYEGSRSPAQYGRVGVNNETYRNEDYQNVVDAVNEWTNDSSIKCIAFEHIPIQEMFYGEESICAISSSGWSIYPSSTGRIDTSAKYVANTSNPTVTGDFHENAGQAYGSTLELFNALADKDNVAGLFFGHEHTNTVTGVATVGGKSLRMGYGGGMLVYSDYAGDSAYADCNPRASFYTLNSSYSGLNDEDNFSKEVLTYFSVTRDKNNKNLYSDNQKYISEVRLFAAETSGEKSGGTKGVGHFDEAVEKCIAAGYTPIEDTYTQNTILDGENYPTVADFNFDCYSWDGATGAKAVCIGYKTTTDPNEAITDIRIYLGAAPGATYTDQELWPDQNNSAITCSATQNATGTNSPVITYYNANYDNNGASLRTDCGQVKFNEGLSALGTSNDAWLFYTKDYRAGLPVKSIFTNITDTYTVAGKEKPFTGTDGYAMYTNLNLNKNNNEYPYSWVQYLDGTYDLARDMAAGNAKRNYTNSLRGGDKQTSCWAFIGMTHALPTDEDLLSENVVETVSPVAVPETVYLTSASGAMTDFQLAVNNVMTVNNGTTKVALQAADTTMKAYFYCPGATLNSVTLSSGTASMTSKTLTFTNSNGLYSFSADLSSDTSYALSSGLAAGGVGTVKWTFNFTIDDAAKSVDAYTTCYAPYQGAVSGIAASTSHKNGYYAYSSSWTAIWGFHEVVDSRHPMYLTGVTGNADGNYTMADSTIGTYRYTLANCTTTPNNYIYEGGAAPNSGNLLASNVGNTVDANSKTGTTFYYKNSESKDDTQVYVSGGTGLITYDPSRVSTLGEIPNFYFGAYFGSFGGNASDDHLVNIERNAGFQMIDAGGNFVKTVKDYYMLPQTSGTDPGFYSATTNSVRARANDIPLSNGCRFISATYQKWINKTSIGGNGASVQANSCANVLFRAVDKTELRDIVAEALQLEAEGKNLSNAIGAASLVLGDPTATSSDVIRAVSNLETEILKVSQGDYIYPAASFFAPEIVYLNPSDKKTFQYFVNDTNNGYDDTADIEAKSNETNGYLVFNGPSGSTVTSLICEVIDSSITSVSINSQSNKANLIDHGFTKNSDGNKVTGSVTAATSSLGSAAASASSTLLKWTVTYTVNARGRNVTQTAIAYTECYAPFNSSVGSNLEANYYPTQDRLDKDSGIAWYTVWISGIHGLYHRDSNKDNTNAPAWEYSNMSNNGSLNSGTSNPTYQYAAMLNDPITTTSPYTVERSTWTGRQNPGAIVSGSNMNYVFRYFNSNTNDAAEVNTYAQYGGNIAGRIYIDSSRYTENTTYSTIPNFKVGTDCHFINAQLGDDRVGFGYDLGSNYNDNRYGDSNYVVTGNANTIPNRYYNLDNKNNAQTNLNHTRKEGSVSQKINTANTKLSAISSMKIRVRSGTNKTWPLGSSTLTNMDLQASVYCDIVYTDKAALREIYLREISSGKQAAYYTSTTWSAYESALKALAVNLETVDATANATLKTNLENAIANLVLKETTVTYRYFCTEDSTYIIDDVSITLPYCTDITATAPEVEGCQYDGYTVSYNGGAAQNGTGDFSYPYSTSDTIVVIFNYSYKNFTLTVDPNGGIYSGETSITQHYNTTTTLSTPTSADAGYHFGGWAITGGGSINGNTYTFGTTDGTATATWAPNTYTVSFDTGVSGITGVPAAITVAYGSDLPGIVVPTRVPGYVFEGYYTGANGEGAKYYNADGTTNVVWSETENKTLYSNWTPIAKEDSFVVDAGLPVKLNASENDLEGYSIIGLAADVNAASFVTKYTGTGFTAELSDGKILFTTTGGLNSTVSFAYKTDAKDSNYGITTVTVIPATSIYFEEDSGLVNFVKAENWHDAGEEAEYAIQEISNPGSATYGSLGAYNYDNSATYSMGTAKRLNVSAAAPNGDNANYAEFTFTGKGFEVNSVTSSNTGYFVYELYEGSTASGTPLGRYSENAYFGYTYGALYLGSDGSVSLDDSGSKLYQANPKDLSAGTIGFGEGRLTADPAKAISNEQASGWIPNASDVPAGTDAPNSLYQIPVIMRKGLDYGTYTVKIIPKYSPIMDPLVRQGSTDYDFYFDSVRIIDPIDPNTTDSKVLEAYGADRELSAETQEIRRILIDKDTFGSADGDIIGIAFLENFKQTDKTDVSTYNEIGPKNEVYLYPGDAIAFNVEASVIPDKISIGTKLLTDDGEGEISVSAFDAKGNVTAKQLTVTSATDVYREIDVAWKAVNGQYESTIPVIVQNTGDVNVSLTNVRWSYATKIEPPMSKLTMSLNRNALDYVSQFNDALAQAANTVAYDGITVEWDTDKVELGDTANLVITAPAEIVKATVDGQELSGYEELENGSKRWTYTLDSAELGSYEYDVVLYDANGYETKSYPTGVCKVVEPVVDINDANISWDKTEINLGETATLSVETSEKIVAVTIGEDRVTDFEAKDGRRVFALQFKPTEKGKYNYTVSLEEAHGYVSTNTTTGILTVNGYEVSTDDIDINWVTDTIETGADAELVIKTPADVEKVIINGCTLTQSETLESGEKQWTYTINIARTGEYEYSVRFVDANGMESSSISTGVIKVEVPQDDPIVDPGDEPGTEPGDEPGDEPGTEKLTFLQKLVRFFKNLFASILVIVKGEVK